MKDRPWMSRAASMAVAVALSAPLTLMVVSLEPELPTLSVVGAQINMMADGSAQLLFDVGIEHVEKSDGAFFHLTYNGNYMVPSNHDTNKALSTSIDDPADPAEAFQASPDLYWVDLNGNGTFDGGEQEDPFMTEKDYQFAVGESSPNYAGDNNIIYDPTKSQGTISLTRWIKRDPALSENEKAHGLTRADIYEAEGTYNVFDATDRVSLGTLSFRVTDLTKLPEIEKLFGNITEQEDPKSAEDSYLLWFSESYESLVKGPWAIGEIQGEGADQSHVFRSGKLKTGPTAAQAYFTFTFPRTIYALELAEPEVTVDAYQAYDQGERADVGYTLQKYSPTVIATFSDGTKQSFVVDWADAVPYTWDSYWDSTAGTPTEKANWTEIVDGAPGAGEEAYDPTGGVYAVRKGGLTFAFADGEEAVTQTFPLPVTAKLTVTPITLVDVAADDLQKTYELTDSLVSATPGAAGRVQTAGEMDLPTLARLVTDVPVDGATLTMDIDGWQPTKTGSAWPDDTQGQGMETLLANTSPDSPAGDADKIHWPTSVDAGQWTDTSVIAHRAGDYEFQMANSYAPTGATAKNFTRPEIQAAYPWLTVPDNNEVPGKPEDWPLDHAYRKLVGYSDNNRLAEDYVVFYKSTETNDQGNVQLTLQVERSGDNSMAEGSKFRVKLPDGTEIGTDHSAVPDSWFTDGTEIYANSGYDEPFRENQTGESGDYNKDFFQIITTPGDNGATGPYAAERERLRRQINLGGWFSVSINEPPPDSDGSNPDKEGVWTDFIPVYVPPRPNHHTESKVYNFLGENAALYPYPTNNDLPTTLVLPKGSFATVDQNGEAEYVLDSENNSVRATQRYGAATTYDGLTGAEPGELNTFTVVKKADSSDAWTQATAGATTTFGDDPFKDGQTYGAFGEVQNPGNKETATVRLAQMNKESPRERITLTYEDSKPATIVNGADGNVDEAIFNTRKEGYTTRQDYVLTITNVGTTDITGMRIDMLTDLMGTDAYDNDGGGGHFVLTKAPASFLPAGGKTTFILTYVYDLEAGGPAGKTYLDKLYITSSSKSNVPGARTEGRDYLLDFDARIEVSQSDIHTVTVNVIPAKGTRTDDGVTKEVEFPMGNARVVVGGDVDNFNTTAGSSSFKKDDNVYIHIIPTDEYSIKSVIGTNDLTGATFSLIEHQVTNPALGDGEAARTFVMPDADVTVTVEFEEGIYSKLRLGELQVFTGEKPENLKETNPTPTVCEIWQKQFTAEEEKHVADMAAGGETFLSQGEYLMTRGTAVKSGLTKVYTEPPDKTNQQYLAVIPGGPEGDYAQVEAILRHVIFTLNDENPDIPVTVSMAVYNQYDEDGKLLTDEDKLQVIYPSNTAGHTSDPTPHTSTAFESPKPGQSFYVRVRLSYTQETNSIERYYFIELHRRPEEPNVQLNYGNSPYGLIMNDGTITGTETVKDEAGQDQTVERKDLAKAAFKANAFSFSGIKSEYVPKLVESNSLKPIHFWSEAWADPGVDVETTDKVYEPESSRGTGYWSTTDVHYHEENNLDLNDYAFFAYLGEGWKDPGFAWAEDSSGRRVDLNETPAQITLTAYTLNAEGETQQERFALPVRANYADDEAYAAALALRTVELDLGEARNEQVEKPADWSLGNIPAVPKVEATETTPEIPEVPAVIHNYPLRPGVYALTYTYHDFNWSEDNTALLSVTRPFVILSPLGDVNADTPNTDEKVTPPSDIELLKNRVADPLGYTAQNYDDAAVFRFRCCDVNMDRNINNIDANALAADKPAAAKLYLPMDYITAAPQS